MIALFRSTMTSLKSVYESQIRVCVDRCLDNLFLVKEKVSKIIANTIHSPQTCCCSFSELKQPVEDRETRACLRLHHTLGVSWPPVSSFGITLPYHVGPGSVGEGNKAVSHSPSFVEVVTWPANKVALHACSSLIMTLVERR